MRIRATLAVAAVLAFGTPAFAESPFVGVWSAKAETQMGVFESTLTVTETDGVVSVAVEDIPPAAAAGAPPMPPMAFTVSDVVVDGDTFSFKRSAETPQGPITVTHTGTISGDAFTGTADSGFGGPVPYTGARK